MTAKDRSQAILDSALAVFAKTGYHTARIEDIAEHAGVAKGTVYLYFPGKKELFQALIEGIAEDLLTGVAGIIEGPGTLRAKLTAVAEQHFDLFRSKKDLTRLNLPELVISDKDLRKKMLLFRERYSGMIASILAESIDDPSLKPDYFRDSAIAFTGLLRAFEMEIMLGRTDLDLEILPERVVRLFLDGVG